MKWGEKNTSEEGNLRRKVKEKKGKTDRTKGEVKGKEKEKKI